MQLRFVDIIKQQCRPEHKHKLRKAYDTGRKNLAEHHTCRLCARNQNFHSARALFACYVGRNKLPVKHNNRIQCKYHYVGVEIIFYLVHTECHRIAFDNHRHNVPRLFGGQPVLYHRVHSVNLLQYRVRNSLIGIPHIEVVYIISVRRRTVQNKSALDAAACNLRFYIVRRSVRNLYVIPRKGLRKIFLYGFRKGFVLGVHKHYGKIL